MRGKSIKVTAVCLSIFILGGCSSLKNNKQQEKPTSETVQTEDSSKKVDQDNKTNTTISNNTEENKDNSSTSKANTTTSKTNTTKTNSTVPKSGNTNQQTTEKKVSNRYSVAGIDNPAEFEKAFNTVKDLVAKNNKSEVAKYIAYPVNVYIDGKKTPINKEADFVKNYDKIMNQKVKSALANQKVSNTFVNQYGVMVGKGELWFSQFKTEKKYCIYGINNK